MAKEKTKKPKDFRDRLIQETKQLQKRLVKLIEFCESNEFHKLSPEMQDLLLVQSGAMATYNNVLQARLRYINSEWAELPETEQWEINL